MERMERMGRKPKLFPPQEVNRNEVGSAFVSRFGGFPGAQSVNIAQMTEAGTMVGQIMTALSKEVGAQRCQLVDCLIPNYYMAGYNPSISQYNIVMLYIYI